MYKKIDMKTKEEILKSKAGTYQFTNGLTFEDSQNLTQAILDAMEEYAEQFKINNSICKINKCHNCPGHYIENGIMQNCNYEK